MKNTKIDLDVFKNDYKNLFELINKVLVLGEYTENARYQNIFYNLTLILKQYLDIETIENEKEFEQKFIDAQNNMEVPF